MSLSALWGGVSSESALLLHGVGVYQMGRAAGAAGFAPAGGVWIRVDILDLDESSSVAFGRTAPGNVGFVHDGCSSYRRPVGPQR